jgi:hypothetical protein
MPIYFELQHWGGPTLMALSLQRNFQVFKASAIGGDSGFF